MEKILIIVLMIAGIFLTVSCGAQTDEPVSLTGVEITEYEGEDLSASRL